MVVSITSFFGRFHPVLVHLPIGILLLAFVFQLLAFSGRYKKLKSAVRPSLFLGMLSAILAAGSGYYLSLEGGYDDRLLTQHKWMGFATAGLAFILFIFSRKYSFVPKNDRKNGVMILFFPLMILLTWTGHLGGSITHGEEYLFQPDQGPLKGEKVSRKAVIVNVEEAEVFNDVIRPLLEEKCFACHSSRKQKGQLRMDEIDLIKKGGKHGKIFVASNPDSSELFKRISLSSELKEHMPPKKEPQLTSAEIEVIRWWISVGAPFDKKGKDIPNRNALTAYLATLSETHHENWLPVQEVTIADEVAVKELQSLGVSVVPVMKNSNYLSVSFSGKKHLEPTDLQVLKKLSPQLVDLNLSWTTVVDKDLLLISEFKELRLLNLAHTSITDNGIAELKSLQHLFYLNLVETKVGNDALASLSQMKNLTELYVFNSGITKEGLLSLKLPTKVDTGKYLLPSLASDTVVFRKK